MAFSFKTKDWVARTTLKTEGELRYSGRVSSSSDNGDRHFSKLFNVEETKCIIHYRIYTACDVVQSVWYNISALIRCNFIIKNYVNRKIKLYRVLKNGGPHYLVLQATSITKFYLTVYYFLTCISTNVFYLDFCFVITGQDYPCQHIDQWPRKTRESTIALATKKKKTCICIK
jgi:hypothetical protein